MNSWSAAKSSVQQQRFDLTLLDLFMPVKNSWQHELAELIEFGTAGVVCILTASLNRGNINQSFVLGARGYIHKSSNFSEIRKALKLTLDGKTYLPPQLMQNQDKNTANNGGLKLTDRQSLILTMIAEGQDNRSIASELGISESTVKRHVHNTFQQLKVGNRTEAVHVARQHGLLQGA